MSPHPPESEGWRLADYEWSVATGVARFVYRRHGTEKIVFEQPQLGWWTPPRPDQARDEERDLAVAYSAEEARHALAPPSWWWLSFAEPRFRGVAIVRARFGLEAVRRTWELEINPGCQVSFEQAGAEHGNPPDGSTDRLITDPDEVRRVAVAWTGEGTETAAERRNRLSS